MKLSGKIYVGGVIALGLLFLSVTFPTIQQLPEQWLVFIVLIVLATLAQFFAVDVPGRQLYYPHHVFFCAGAFLLAPFLFALEVIIAHVAEMMRAIWQGTETPTDWHAQSFNIAVFILAGFAAHLLYWGLNPAGLATVTYWAVLSATLAAIAYVAVNYLLVSLVLVIVERLSWQESGIFSPDNLLSDFVLTYMGYLVAVAWSISGWLLLPVLAPLVPMYRSLMIPKLTKEAQVDSKTRLLNARSFNERFTKELELAQRRQLPLALIMADLDYLRTINNTYGHQAGDVVLEGIGNVIRENIRLTDSAARFGGEEFAIILPNTDQAGAVILAERLRVNIAAAEFVIPTQPAPIRATMSLGIACFPADATTTATLLYHADIAVYSAKTTGRNRVACFADLPQSVKEAGIPGAAPTHGSAD